MKNLIHDFKSTYNENENFRSIVKSFVEVISYLIAFAFFLITLSVWLLYLGRIYK